MTPNGIPVRNFVENQGSREQVLGAGEETGKSKGGPSRGRGRGRGRPALASLSSSVPHLSAGRMSQRRAADGHSRLQSSGHHFPSHEPPGSPTWVCVGPGSSAINGPCFLLSEKRRRIHLGSKGLYCDRPAAQGTEGS